MLAEVEAVVAEQHHDRPVAQLQAVEGLEEDAHLRVHERHAGVVGRGGLAPELVVALARATQETRPGARGALRKIAISGMSSRSSGGSVGSSMRSGG